MTQLYVGNLSADADEAAIRALFSKYGVVRETLMKNGYAFVEYDTSLAAEEAIRALNGTDILGHPMIVEPSHQQRLSSRRKLQCGKVEVSGIPPHMTYQGIEAMLGQVGQVLKMEIEDGDYGMKRIIVTYESMEQAQRASATFKGDEHTPRVTFIEVGGANGMKTTRRGSPGIPSSPSKSNSDFPLRILVPSDMVGAIIGKDGATIRMITQLTKARVDVHRRENLGSAEKAITIIGPPECCTEACYQIMKIMQNELLTTSGMMENGAYPDAHIHLYDEPPPPLHPTRKYHEPLPVVPLKILAHNELVGRVIGKGGNTLKRIMAESGTKITISKLKDLTAYNMERTITILGTIDNCKKAESLISAKLRASYESDMAQFIPEQNHVPYPGPQTPLSPSPGPPPTSNQLPEMPPFGTRLHPHSLPATPTAANVRTFTDFSAEHTRLTTLHGSAGALEVNNLGGFKLGPLAMNGGGPMNGAALNGGGGGMMNGSGLNGMNGASNPVTPSSSSSAAKFPSVFFDSTIDGVVKSSNGGMNGMQPPTLFPPPPLVLTHNPYDVDDEISDVFSGLSMDPGIAAPGYGRGRNRRCSAPVNSSNPWGSEFPENGSENPGYFIAPPPPPKAYSSNALSSAGWNSVPVTTGTQSTVSSIWTTPFQGSRPESQASSYSNSNSDQGSSLSGYSPIYSPVATTNGFFEVSSGTANPMTTVPMSEDQRPSFKVSLPTTLTTVAENTVTTTSLSGSTTADDHDEELLKRVTSTALELIGDTHPNMSGPPASVVQW